jgi:hypothetical protein
MGRDKLSALSAALSVLADVLPHCLRSRTASIASSSRVYVQETPYCVVDGSHSYR